MQAQRRAERFAEKREAQKNRGLTKDGRIEKKFREERQKRCEQYKKE